MYCPVAAPQLKYASKVVFLSEILNRGAANNRWCLGFLLLLMFISQHSGRDDNIEKLVPKKNCVFVRGTVRGSNRERIEYNHADKG